MTDLSICSNLIEELLREEKEEYEWQLHHRVDKACSVKIDATESELAGSIRLTHKCFHGAIHTYDYEQDCHLEQKAPESKSFNFLRVIQLMSLDCRHCVDNL